MIAAFIAAVVGALDHFGYTALVHFDAPNAPGGLQRACDRVRPVGLIAPAAHLPPLEPLQGNGTRGIVTWGPAKHAGLSGLLLDQQRVGAVAVGHLVERGHTRLLAITPLEDDLRWLSQVRMAGARAVARTLGVTLTDVPANDLRRGLAEWPTAVYAFNDEYALSARDALPEGVAIIGTDDSPAARLTHPELTTISLGSPDEWVVLAELLHAATRDPAAEPTTVVVEPRVVQGATT